MPIPIPRPGALVLAAALLAGPAAARAQPPSLTAERPFLAENHAAMIRMMSAMDVQPTGDVDADFVAMMVAHHQGAIDMAQALLRHGGSEPLRRIAQEIIVEQQQEIAAMRMAVGQPLPPSLPSPDQFAPASAQPAEPHHHSMER